MSVRQLSPAAIIEATLGTLAGLVTYFWIFQPLAKFFVFLYAQGIAGWN